MPKYYWSNFKPHDFLANSTRSSAFGVVSDCFISILGSIWFLSLNNPRIEAMMKKNLPTWFCLESDKDILLDYPSKNNENWIISEDCNQCSHHRLHEQDNDSLTVTMNWKTCPSMLIKLVMIFAVTSVVTWSNCFTFPMVTTPVNYFRLRAENQG